MTLGERIRTERESQGLTLNALARKANISPAYLSQLENDKSKDPSIQIAFKIAAALDTTVLYLFKGETEKKSCETCYFCEHTYYDGDLYMCHRYPPHYAGDADEANFSEVNADDWCGEWKPKAAASLDR